MKTNEFRIGNLIYGLNDENHSKKEVDMIAVINLIGWETMNGKTGIQPITLTEDWLRKFGFVYMDGLKHWVKNWGTNGVEFIKFDNHYNMFAFQLGEGKYKVIEFVHRLQGLWYELTDTELTINLNENKSTTSI